MISYNNVSAIIVTKGDRDISNVVASLPFGEVIVWDNSKEVKDRKIYGRYLAIEKAKYDVIYVQDDDCILEKPEVLATLYREDKLICNVTDAHWQQYAPLGIGLVGWGAIFHKKLANFKEYLDNYPLDDMFERECDRVFTGLNEFKRVLLNFEHMPYAYGLDRMGYEKWHASDFSEILKRVNTIKASRESRHSVSSV